MIYVPNVGEKEMLKDILAAGALVLGLYKNQVVPDGNTVIDTLEELPTGGGRGYAPVALGTELFEGSVAADLWSISMDANGKAMATWSNANLSWVFTAVDVADGHTAYGVFGFSWVLPFDTGGIEIRPGDIVEGASSGAIGIVTSVLVYSGAWADGDAAGDLRIKTKSGTFQNNENIIISGSIGTVAIASGGGGYVEGDIVTVVQEGGARAKLVVLAIGSGGAATDLVVVEGGQGYAEDTDLETEALSGAGEGLTVDISALGATALALTNTGTGADAVKKLRYMDSFSQAQPITPVGFNIQYPAALTVSTSS